MDINVMLYMGFVICVFLTVLGLMFLMGRGFLILWDQITARVVRSTKNDA
jgi:hypothetical protein